MKHGKNPLYSWFPLYGEKWLFGSTRYELSHAERAIFIDLLALANRDNGFIRANEQFPYTIEHLSGMLRADVELVSNTLEKCVEHKKIERLESGIYRVISWKDFSLTDRRKRQVESFPKKRKRASDSSEAPLISSNVVSSPLISLSSSSPIRWEGIQGEDMEAWRKAYPACDIDSELKKAIEWIKANPEKGKKSNYRRFIVNWLSRSQDRGGSMRGSSNRGRTAGGVLDYIEEEEAKERAGK